VIQPRCGCPSRSSTGPKDPIPSASSGPRVDRAPKKASEAAIVSAGAATSIRAVSMMSSGPVPRTQTNFVPPASMPPYIVILHVAQAGARP